MVKKKIWTTGTTTKTGTAEVASYDDMKKCGSDRDTPNTIVDYIGEVEPFRPHKVSHELALAHVANAEHITDVSPPSKGMTKEHSVYEYTEEDNKNISKHQLV